MIVIFWYLFEIFGTPNQGRGICVQKLSQPNFLKKLVLSDINSHHLGLKDENIRINSKYKRNLNHTINILGNCSLCQYKGRDNYNLSRHLMQKHSLQSDLKDENKKYFCVYCDYYSHKKYNLSRHVKNHYIEYDKSNK